MVSVYNRNWDCGGGRKISDMKICKKAVLKNSVWMAIKYNRPQDNRV